SRSRRFTDRKGRRRCPGLFRVDRSSHPLAAAGSAGDAAMKMLRAIICLVGVALLCASARAGAAENWQSVQTFRSPSAPIGHLSLIEDGRYLVVGESDGRLR